MEVYCGVLISDAVPGGLTLTLCASCQIGGQESVYVLVFPTSSMIPIAYLLAFCLHSAWGVSTRRCTLVGGLVSRISIPTVAVEVD